MKKEYKMLETTLALVIALCLFASCGETENITDISALYAESMAGVSDVSAFGEDNSTHENDASFIFSEGIIENDASAEEDNTLKEKIKIYFNDYFLNNEKYTRKVASVFGFSSEGASVDGVYNNDVLKILSISLYGELGSITSHYYIIDSETVLLVENICEYSAHIMNDNWAIEREYSKLYIVLNDEAYRFDILEMKAAEKYEDFSKELFDSAISALEESDDE